MRRFLLALLLSAAAVLPAAAQSTAINGSIEGVISDESAAAVAERDRAVRGGSGRTPVDRMPGRERPGGEALRLRRPVISGVIIGRHDPPA